ncbi:MAG: hypothetical protein M3Y08_17195 [Fibrobacterota bacterium]|nr:hypothetical protein [Fibrobacterota bacterium]
MPKPSVKGFVSLAGPVRTTWTDADVQEAMGPSEGWPDTYPANFIDGGNAPLLLLHGSKDRAVAAPGLGKASVLKDISVFIQAPDA